MRHLISFILFGYLAFSFITLLGSPIGDEQDDEDDNDYDLLKVSNTTTGEPDISLKYNKGAITISSTSFNKNLSLRISDEKKEQRYVVYADLSTHQESFALFLSDGTYLIAAKDEEDNCSTTTTITIQNGEGSSTIK